ncbi:hypothetical protein [Aureliella helgolandensis]|uniref:Glycosyltransferase RgtA/B/C/D-like domain-containing protein n=1 Tax=Aureliella helgolandensis TaxID=2527968 RepID=A0A518G0E3_9BACT|nr:hypothetical protein [Aureliella helgolandensis]QDV22077.1 hypothetical protein Q31a_03560 [Aureliella helgolandensis]
MHLSNLGNSPFLAGLVILTCGLWQAWAQSPTYDEVGFMGAGLSHWKTGQFEPFAVNPPLPRLLSTLPVYLLSPKLEWGHTTQDVYARDEFYLGNQFLEMNASRTQLYFFIARIPNLLLASLGLVLSRKWANRLYGARARTLVTWMWTLSPMVLSNSALMSPDIGAAVIALLAFWVLRNWIVQSSWSNAVLLGACTGLLLSWKITWIPFVFPCYATIWVAKYWHSYPSHRTLLVDASQALVAFVLCCCVVNGTYAFDQVYLPLGSIPLHSQGMASGELGIDNRFSRSWVGSIPSPLPSVLLQGIDLQKLSFENPFGSRSYLAGTWKEGGWWYYYAVAWLCKTPVSVCVLLVLACLTLALSRQPVDSQTAPKGFPHWLDKLIIALPLVAIVLFVSSETGFNRHLRYVLPAYPFLFVWISRVGAFRGLGAVCRVLLLLQATSLFWHGPHWLSYFNELAGGPRNGGAWLLSSNID